MFTVAKNHGIGILLVLSTPVTFAQIVLDGTLGQPGELTGPNFNIAAELGQQVGDNLFHSFQTFNVQSGETATFSGPDTVTNVISRVTGGQSSLLNGLLQLTIPNADFYLLNPAGVMFGPEAKLDVPGSFHVSTANYLRLSNNGRFDVSEPAKSVLTVAPPAAFGFLTESPGKIESEKSLLVVSREQTLSWVGGDLSIRNGHLAVGKLERMVDGRIGWAQGGGRINLVSVATTGEVPIIPEELPEGEFSKFGHISITDDTVGGQANLDRTVGNIDASGARGGKIYIRGGQITMDNGYVFADTWGNQSGQGIWVKAQEELAMRNGARITTETPEKARSENTGNAGKIEVQARQLSLSGGSQIVSSSNTLGTAGDVTVTAADSIKASGQWQFTLGGRSVNSGMLSRSLRLGTGGSVTVSSPLITLSDGGVILTTTQGLGDAGNVTVQADNQLVLESGGHISVSTGHEQFKSGNGSAGSINITAHRVLISGRPTEDNPSGLRSNTYTAGNGGDITVAAPEIILQAGGSIQAGAEGKGRAGNITIEGEVEQLSLLGGGKITTESKLSGGGNISLQPTQWLYVLDGTITAEAMGEQPSHQGGNLTIGQLENRSLLVILGQRSSLKANAYAGHGGNILMVAENYIKSGEEVVLDASSQLGEPGEVSIDASEVDLTKGFNRLSTKTFKPVKLLSHRCPIGPKQDSFNVFKLESAYPNPVDLQFYLPEFSEVGL